ncbi:MAG TPA: serine/threonine-protein kinase [Pyrinomonadaceae bacterium]
MRNRWLRIEELFHAALELEASQRADLLAHSCKGDKKLQKEIESLLANSTVPVDIIDNPPVVDAIQVLAGALSSSLEGQVIQRYQILSMIGEGGMGQVYLALDQLLNRKVALKFLNASLFQDDENVGRLAHEARAASALNHPNIVTIYELGQHELLPFIAMEFVEGETLRQKLHSQRPLREVVSVAIQVASALAVAHQTGILHRDIKPENIIESSDGSIKVLDFGIAKFRESEDSVASVSRNARITMAGGTLSYMSPEQARGETLDARSDIYSLGVVLYELITAHRPFSGETKTELFTSLLTDEIPDLKALRADVPHDLQRIVGKALEKNREQRYRSAKELLADLREFDRLSGTQLDNVQRANRMLRQYLSIYAVDKRALIPLNKLTFIHKHSDGERGQRGQELFRKSLIVGLVKSLGLSILLVFIIGIGTAVLSIDERWDEVVLKDGHQRAVRQSAFSPDGKKLVSVGEDNQIIVWDFLRRLPIARLKEHNATVTSVAFTPDGTLFATTSEDGTLILWDTNTLAPQRSLHIGGQLITVTFSPYAPLMAVASFDPKQISGLVSIWETKRWEKVRELPSRMGSYGTLHFERDGKDLISTASQKWDLATGREITSESPGMTNWLAYSPDGSHLVRMGGGGYVGSIDLNNEKDFQYIEAHQDNGRSAAFSPDGSLLATAADDIVLWNPLTMTKLARFQYPSIVWNVAFSPAGKFLVSSHGDGSVVIWDVVERRQIALLNGHSGPVRSIAFAHNGSRIASGSEDRSIILWNANTGRKEALLQGSLSRVTGVGFSIDDQELIASEFMHNLRIWDLTSEKDREIPHSEGARYCIAISNDGRWLATTTGVFDSVSGARIVDFAAVMGTDGCEMYGLAFSPDGKILIGVSPAGVISTWNTSDWTLREKLKLNDTHLVAISLAPDGRSFVTGDDEGRVSLWSTTPIVEKGEIGRHSSRIKSVALSPDGTEVCSAGDDQTIALWNVSARRLVTKIGTHTSPVLAVAFSPDGRRIVSGEHDSSVRLYTRHRWLWGWRLN